MDDLMVSFFLVVICVIVIVSAAVGFGGVRFDSTGNGTHNGYVTAIQQQGYFFPNYHVFVKTDNSSSQEDEYCVNRSNGALIAKLNDFSKKRTRVTLFFHGVKGIGFGLCHGQEIDSVSVDTAQ